MFNDSVRYGFSSQLCRTGLSAPALWWQGACWLQLISFYNGWRGTSSVIVVPRLFHHVQFLEYVPIINSTVKVLLATDFTRPSWGRSGYMSQSTATVSPTCGADSGRVWQVNKVYGIIRVPQCYFKTHHCMVFIGFDLYSFLIYNTYKTRVFHVIEILFNFPPHLHPKCHRQIIFPQTWYVPFLNHNTLRITVTLIVVNNMEGIKLGGQPWLKCD